MRLDAASAAAFPFVRSRSHGWNLNNNNRALSVANLTNAGRSVDSMGLLGELLETYFVARSNKRRSRDAVLFEMDFEKSLVRLCNDLNGRRLDTTPNYAFVVFSPKAREIFATAMYVRIVHHYLDRKLRPIYEDELSDRTYNNRKGKGLHACIARFREDVREMTRNYTRDAWIVHLKDAIANWAVTEYTRGKDIIPQRAIQAIYKVPGIDTVNVEVSENGTTWQSSRIAVPQGGFASLPVENITIVGP